MIEKDTIQKPIETSWARPSDVSALVALLGASVPDCTPQTVWELPWTWHHYRVVRTAGGAIAGAASSRPIAKGRAEIRGLTVAPTWRNHGIARALVRDLIEDAERNDMDVVCVTRSPDLFAKFGFHETPPTWLDHHRRSTWTSEPSERRVAMSRELEMCS